MYIGQIIIFLFLFVKYATGYIEFVEVSGCESCRLHLTCRHLSSVLAILEATYRKNDTSDNTTLIPTLFPPFHPRLALNQRCSGLNYCSFILTKDCPGADRWGPGELYIKYACVSEQRMEKYCNAVINLPSKESHGVSDGFARNPGYPRFYSGQETCKWTIKAPANQSVKITILDLAIFGENTSNDGCADRLEVRDSTQTIYTTCTEEEPPVELQTGSETMEVVLASSRIITPRRGVLFYYTAVGCFTPPIPKNAFLIHRNDTTAVFSCCVGYSFPDTNRQSKVLNCHGHQWDVQLPIMDCENKTGDIDKRFEIISTQELKPYCKTMGGESNADILIPTLIIVALFIINFIVVFIIYKYRQKHREEYLDEELGTLSHEDMKL